MNRFEKAKLWSVFLLFSIFAFYLFTRLFLLSQQGAAGFGYDTGIYRHYIDGYYERLNDPSITPFGFSGYSNVLKSLDVSTDDILISWYVLVAMVLFFLFFLFVKTYTDVPTALFAVFLFSISTIQYEFFWWFYYRNFLAFALFFVTFILFHYRSYLALLPLMAIGTLHIITLVPIGCTMIVLLWLEKEKRKYYFITGSVAVVGIVLLNFKELRDYFFSLQKSGTLASGASDSSPEFNGQFIDFSFFWKNTLLYLFFGIAGYIQYFKKHLSLAIFFIMSLIPVLFQVLFYRRFYVFVDVVLIFFASIFIVALIRKVKSTWMNVAVGIYVLIGFFLSTQYVWTKQPLLTHFDLEEMVSTNEFPPARVLAVSSATAPWLYGFTHHTIIAPGIFEENKWSREEWQEFWATENANRRHELLSVYQEPLFIYVGPREKGFESVLRSDDHFIQRRPSVWEYKK